MGPVGSGLELSACYPQIWPMPVRAFALVLILLSPPSLAAPPAPERAAQLVEETFQRAADAVVQRQAAVQANPGQAYRLIDQVLAPHVDFELMARLVLGRHWASASADQRRRFTAAFRESLLRTYSVVLADNVDEIARRLRRHEPVLKIQPVRAPQGETRVVVRTVLTLAEGTIAMDYRMHARGQEWKVYDLSILNVSFVTNLRMEYDALLRADDLEAVIARLERRNASQR